MRRNLGVRALVGVAFGALLLGQTFGVWWWSHAQSTPCPADTLLVMGAAQYDGEPSPAFARRLDRARELYETGCAPRILVTGGKQPGDRFTEGDAGARYLASRGVPEAALLRETESRSSYQNLLFSRPQIADDRVLIVTDDLHAYRTELLARHLGLTAVVAPVPTQGARLPYLLREAAGVTAYWLGLHH